MPAKSGFREVPQREWSRKGKLPKTPFVRHFDIRALDSIRGIPGASTRESILNYRLM